MFANLLKKQWINSYGCLVGLLLGIVALSIYQYTVGWANSYWVHDELSLVTGFSVWAIILFALALVVANLAHFLGEKKGFLKDVCFYVASALEIVSCCFLLASGIIFIGDRAEGIAYILFSDASVLTQVQTPANMFSVNLSIAATIIYIIAGLVPVVTSFFPFIRHTEKKEEVTQA